MPHMTIKLQTAMRELTHWTSPEQDEIAERIWHEIRQREAGETDYAIRDLTAYQPAAQVG